MPWDLAISAVAKLLERLLIKVWPSAAEKSKKIRLDAEERYKKALLLDEKRLEEYSDEDSKDS